MRRFIPLIIMGVLFLQLMACATTDVVDRGTVINQMKLKDKDYAPKSSTDTGALAGGGVGVAAGTATGLLFTMATFGLGAPLVPVFAVAGGVAGGATGAAVGYGADLQKQGNGLYDYVVKTDKDDKKIIVQQYAHENIPNGTRVKVLKEDGALKIMKE